MVAQRCPRECGPGDVARRLRNQDAGVVATQAGRVGADRVEQFPCSVGVGPRGHCVIDDGLSLTLAGAEPNGRASHSLAHHGECPAVGGQSLEPLAGQFGQCPRLLLGQDQSVQRLAGVAVRPVSPGRVGVLAD